MRKESWIYFLILLLEEERLTREPEELELRLIDLEEEDRELTELLEGALEEEDRELIELLDGALEEDLEVIELRDGILEEEDRVLMELLDGVLVEDRRTELTEDGERTLDREEIELRLGVEDLFVVEDILRVTAPEEEDLEDGYRMELDVRRVVLREGAV